MVDWPGLVERLLEVGAIFLGLYFGFWYQLGDQDQSEQSEWNHRIGRYAIAVVVVLAAIAAFYIFTVSML